MFVLADPSQSRVPGAERPTGGAGGGRSDRAGMGAWLLPTSGAPASPSDSSSQLMLSNQGQGIEQRLGAAVKATF